MSFVPAALLRPSVPMVFVPFFVSLVLTKVIIVLSHRKGLVRNPTEDRWHKRPTPIFGGVAIFLASVTGVLLFGRSNVLNQPWMLSLATGAALMFAVGFVDDLVKLRPQIKLLFQIFAAAIVMGSGIYFQMVPPILGIPLSGLWLIGITNAFNLLDNMDGLAAGIASIVCLNIAIFGHLSGGWISLPALVLMGALGGFLVFNFHPAKIFMGDGGSLFIGFTLAALTIVGSNRDVSNLAMTILFPLLIMAVPIFDTTLVTVLRNVAGRKVSQGGRDHSSHRLVALGLSERNTVILLYLVSLLTGGVVIAFTVLSRATLVVMAVLLWVVLYYFGTFLAQAEVYGQQIRGIGHRVGAFPRRILSLALSTWRAVTEMLIDFLLVCVSLTIGYLLRYEGKLQDSDTFLLVFSFPVVVPIKLGCLYLFGVYRQMWRYLGARDLLQIFKACSLGSILSVVVLVLIARFHGFSRAVHVIDWITFLVLVISSRLVIRLLRESFLRLQAQGTDAMLYGAGDAGNLFLLEAFSQSGFPHHLVAAFDDDPSKHGRMIHGVPILGGVGALEKFAKMKKIRRLVIAIPSGSDEDLAHVLTAAGALDLEVFRYVPARLLRLGAEPEHRPPEASTGEIEATTDTDDETGARSPDNSGGS